MLANTWCSTRLHLLLLVNIAECSHPIYDAAKNSGSLIHCRNNKSEILNKKMDNCHAFHARGSKIIEIQLISRSQNIKLCGDRISDTSTAHRNVCSILDFTT